MLVQEDKYQEAINTPLGNVIYEASANVSGEYIGSYDSLPLLETKKPEGEKESYDGSIRIYFNPPAGLTRYEFLYTYIIKCLDKNLTYYMKGNDKSSHLFADGAIFYVPIEDLEQHLEILEEIKKEHPEIISKFGSPRYRQQWLLLCCWTQSAQPNI